MTLDAYDAGTVQRMRDAALALLPPGRAFSRRLDSMIARVLEGLCIEFARVHRGAALLLENVSPRRARDPDMVAAWEEAAGITTPTGTTAARAQAVADRIRGTVAFNLAAYQAIATELGYTLPGPLESSTGLLFRAGASRAGDRVYGPAWAYAFVGRVHGPDVTLQLNALAAAWRTRAGRAHTYVVAKVIGASEITPMHVDAAPMFIDDRQVVL